MRFFSCLTIFSFSDKGSDIKLIHSELLMHKKQPTALTW